jgi:hypothetical protein
LIIILSFIKTVSIFAAVENFLYKNKKPCSAPLQTTRFRQSAQGKCSAAAGQTAVKKTPARAETIPKALMQPPARAATVLKGLKLPSAGAETVLKAVKTLSAQAGINYKYF